MLHSALWLLFCSPLFAQVALEGVTVIDLETGVRHAGWTVVAGKDAILQAGPSRTVSVPKGVARVPAKGRFLIPGLWDMHVHLWDQENVLPLYLRYGVTGVRDMGSEPGRVARWRREMSEGLYAGPRIVTSGPAIDGRASTEPKLPVLVATDPASARRAVQEARQGGADFIKVFSSLNREAFLAVLDEARSLGLQVAGHTPELVSAWEAVAKGMNSMEHLFGVTTACSSDYAALEPQRIAARLAGDRDSLRRLSLRYADTWSPERAMEFFRQSAANGVRHVPSLVLWNRMTLHEWERASSDPRWSLLPESLRRTWPDLSKEAAQMSPRQRDAASRERERIFGMIPLMAKAGVEILAGTDTGDPHTLPGATLQDELRMLVEAGLSPLQALRAATTAPARFLRLNAAIAPGGLSDMVLLEADPTAGIRNLGRVAGVVRQGRYYSAKELQAKATPQAALPAPPAR